VFGRIQQPSLFGLENELITVSIPVRGSDLGKKVFEFATETESQVSIPVRGSDLGKKFSSFIEVEGYGSFHPREGK
jgi:hypothetical protein